MMSEGEAKVDVNLSGNLFQRQLIQSFQQRYGILDIQIISLNCTTIKDFKVYLVYNTLLYL